MKRQITVFLSLSFLFFCCPYPLWAADENFFDKSLAFLSKYVAKDGWIEGGAAVLAGLLFAFLFYYILSLTEKGLKERNPNLSGVIGAFRIPLFCTFFIKGLLFGLNFMSFSEGSYLIVEKILKTVLLLIWVYYVCQINSLALLKISQVGKAYSIIQSRTVTLFDNGAKVVVFGLATYLFFIIWNIDLTAWLASAGIIGIAVGFAAKDTLSNLFAGVFILADAPYRVGDYVMLDGGDRGKVLHIGLRSTRLLTRDDVEVIIPNSIMGNTTVTNQSGGPRRYLRIRVKIGVAYGCDIDQVRELLLSIAKEDSGVISIPEPRVRFRSFGGSSLNLELLCWVRDPELRGRVLDSVNTQIYKQFTEKGIEIPFTKYDLYVKEVPDTAFAPKE